MHMQYFTVKVFKVIRVSFGAFAKLDTLDFEKDWAQSETDETVGLGRTSDL